MKFIVIFGPPATGKMTIGQELSKITSFKLLHNHMSIELILKFFEYGTPKFQTLSDEFRIRIMEEVASSDLPGLIFTYVWGFNSDEDKEYIHNMSEIFREHDGTTYYVELYCELEERLRRNRNDSRISEKPSKRDKELSEERLLRMENEYKMNTEDDFYYNENFIKINNTKLSAIEVAEKIKKEFEL
ncbi:MAG: AAA family ATPase [Candidatus Heimdallarchaeaceae archaeon]